MNRFAFFYFYLHRFDSAPFQLWKFFIRSNPENSFCCCEYPAVCFFFLSLSIAPFRQSCSVSPEFSVWHIDPPLFALKPPAAAIPLPRELVKCRNQMANPAFSALDLRSQGRSHHMSDRLGYSPKGITERERGREIKKYIFCRTQNHYFWKMGGIP